MSKTLTIAIACYNVEPYLDRALQSLSDPRLANDVEVLVINDGSTDGTVALAQPYVDAMPQMFRLIDKANGGHGSVVNTGIAEASGTYFRMLDGDDWVKTDNLVGLVEQLKNCNSDLVIDEKTHVDMATMIESPQLFPAYIETGKELNFPAICNSEDTESYISIHTMTVRTSLLRRNGVHVLEGIFYEDYEFIVKSTCYAQTVTFLPFQVYQYLLGNANQSVSAANWVKRYWMHEKVARELVLFAKETSFGPEITQYLFRKNQLIIHTHYNVLLIFDTDRKRGAKRAKEFNTWLAAEDPALFAAVKPRYRIAKVLHTLGVDAPKLEKIMGR